MPDAGVIPPPPDGSAVVPAGGIPPPPDGSGVVAQGGGDAPDDLQDVNSDIQTESALREDVVGAAKSVANVATAPVVHLKNAITSLAHGEYSDAAMHFLHAFTDDPASQIVDQQLQSSKQAKDRMVEAGKAGDALGVAQHAAGMVPGASQVDAAMTKYQEEPNRANLVHIMTTALPLLIPGAMKGAGDIA